MSTIAAGSSDLPSVLAALGLGAGVKAWLPFAVAAGIAAWVFANRDFRATREMIVGGLVIGAVIVGGWYVSGHVGFLAEDPKTLEEKFVATNSGRMESFSFVAPVAYLLELLVYWTDQSRVLTFGIAARARHDRRVGGDGAGDEDLPLGGLCLDRGSRQPRRRAVS